MSQLKKKVVEMIKILPEDVTVDEIIAELHFKQQVDTGLKELDEGKGLSQDDVERRMSKWSKK